MSSLQDSIRNIQKSEAEESEKSPALRKIRTAIHYIITKTGQSMLPDDEVILLIKREIKSRKEQSERYKSAGRDDLALVEIKEADVLNSILPPEIGENEIALEAENIIKTIDKSSLSVNSVMGRLMNQFQGQNIDGKRAVKIVENLLEN